jgi:hypothetical protein
VKSVWDFGDKKHRISGDWKGTGEREGMLEGKGAFEGKGVLDGNGKGALEGWARFVVLSAAKDRGASGTNPLRPDPSLRSG